MYDEDAHVEYYPNSNKVPLYKYEKSEKIVKAIKWLDFEIDWEMVGSVIVMLIIAGVVGLTVWNVGVILVQLYTMGSGWFWGISIGLSLLSLYGTGKFLLYRHKRVLERGRSYGVIDE